MERYLLDRWTDTTVFRLLLFLSGCLVVPILSLGVLATVLGGADTLLDRSTVDLREAVIALLSIGGALGFIGYLRANLRSQEPNRHNVTATLVCLAAGIGAALAVAALVTAEVVEERLRLWSSGGWLWLWASGGWLGLWVAFVAANTVWALAGAAGMQRVTRRYADRMGRAFDSLPVVLLLVAIALATAAALVAVTL